MTGTSRQALEQPDAALVALQKSLNDTVDTTVEQLDPKTRGRLIDTLAWFDDDPRSLTVNRGVRGAVSHVSARFLAFDVAPGLAAKPSTERALAALASGGIVRALSGASSKDELKLVRAYPRLGGGARFLVEQRWSKTRVYRAGLSFDLDASGRLTRFDSTVVPAPTPVGGTLIDETTARASAEEHLRKHGGTWSKGSLETSESEPVIVHLLPFADKDASRQAWRFVIRVKDDVAAVREVLVDRLDKSIIADVDQIEYLDGRDRIERVSGTIGGGSLGFEGVLWNGTESCPGTDSAISGATPLERDLDEASAALCEAERMFASVGAELGEPDARRWMDRGGDGVILGIGATPLLSVGMNTGSALIFAEGVARAEIVGHEIFHTTLGQFGYSGYGSAEGGAITEHLCDAFGTLLERRFPRRQENACLMNDDPDTLAAIGAQDLSSLPDGVPFRPCAAEGLPRPWRNTCEPTADNGGWCEGAATYRDLGYNKYDAYGDTGPRSSAHVASHTNLGVGNRVIQSLLGNVARPAPFRVNRVAEADVTRLVLGAATELGAQTDWAAYGDGLVRIARMLGGTGAVTPLERELRAALANARLWSVAQAVMPRPAPGEPSVVVAPPPGARPAVARVALTGAHAGRERTFAFYKPNAAATSIEFVWRDDVDGGETAEPSDGWMGPCTLPGAVTTGSPAAAGGEQAIFVAWGEPTGTPGQNRLRGLALTGEAASAVSSGCGFDFSANDPLTERTIVGSPAIAVWGASEHRTRCEVLREDFPGLSFPFRTIGAMGISIGDCVDIGERIPPYLPTPLPPDFAKYLSALLVDFIDTSPARLLPQPVDPLGPRLPDLDPALAARFDLVAQLRSNPKAQDAAVKLPEVGGDFKKALGSYGYASGLGIEAVLEQRIKFDKDLPEGPIETIDLRFHSDMLVVAFNAPDGKLHATTWTDLAPTSAVATLAPASPVDPALTQAKALTADEYGTRVEANFLYAVYTGTETVDGTTRPRLRYNVARVFDPDLGGLRDSSFDGERPLDDVVETVGRRRQRDYRFLRTNRTPVVAGGERQLHVFTVARAQRGEVPDDSVTGDASPSSDRVRYAVFDVGMDGKLEPASERPVLLPKTRVSMTSGEAGAAIGGTARGRVRWYYPNGMNLEMRSEVVR